MRTLTPLFLFSSVRGFFHPLGWEGTPLEYSNFAEITPDKYYIATLKDWCNHLLPSANHTSSDSQNLYIFFWCTS
jgi:hypothetical protein